MICRNCNKPIDNDSNFCKHCAEAQREKCPECGEMEKIGRVVCESMVKQIHTEQSVYIAKTLPHLENYSLIPGVLVGAITLLPKILSNGGLTFPITAPFFVGMSIMFFSIILWVLLEAVLSPRMVKNAQQKFLKENPEYAEILKQAEEDGLDSPSRARERRFVV